VDYEFGISAGAKLVQIEALAFAFGRHALRAQAVEQPIETIGERQHETKQGGDAGDLSQRLHGGAGGGKEAERQHAPDAADGVNGNRAGGVVDFAVDVQPLDREDDQCASHQAGQRGRRG
jgi:hypothetical protein